MRQRMPDDRVRGGRKRHPQPGGRRSGEAAGVDAMLVGETSDGPGPTSAPRWMSCWAREILDFRFWILDSIPGTTMQAPRPESKIQNLKSKH